jgi:hypothetical protein
MEDRTHDLPDDSAEPEPTMPLSSDVAHIVRLRMWTLRMGRLCPDKRLEGLTARTVTCSDGLYGDCGMMIGKRS